MNANETATLLAESVAARRLGISRTTLGRWRRGGQGPPFVQIGVTIRYDPAALDRWISDHSSDGTGPKEAPDDSGDADLPPPGTHRANLRLSREWAGSATGFRPGTNSRGGSCMLAYVEAEIDEPGEPFDGYILREVLSTRAPRKAGYPRTISMVLTDGLDVRAASDGLAQLRQLRDTIEANPACRVCLGWQYQKQLDNGLWVSTAEQHLNVVAFLPPKWDEEVA